MDTGVLLKTFKTDIIGRPQSVKVSFRFFSFVPCGYWCYVKYCYNRQTKEHHCLVSDFVLFPVDTGVLFKMLKTGK